MRAGTPSSPLVRWLNAAWSHTPEIREMECEGAAVSYRAWGLDATHLPGLMFMHGFRAHARWWDHIAPHFTDRFRVVAQDFTGMGDSGRRAHYSRRQFAREILTVAEHAGFERPVLVAHSFGGATSMLACKMAPTRVARVVVIDSHIFPPQVEGAPVEPTPERIYVRREDALARYRLIPPGGWPDPNVLAYIAEHSLRRAEHGWTWKFDNALLTSLGQDLIRAEIRDLDTPMDFIHADNSELVGASELKLVLENSRSCGRVVTVPLSHHHVMIEQPVGLVAALNGLLAR
jgi:pimeloyl-ACP methyl ester carboxylesterase